MRGEGHPGQGGPPASAADGRPGLRERKAAATRLALVDALRRRLATTALADVGVDQLAEDANVSRMTFFNYFPAKDHAVDLLMAIWLFRVEHAIARDRLTGARAVERTFAMMGDEVAESPDRMRRIVGYFASRPSDRPLPVLGRAERALLEPDAAEGRPDPLSLGGLFVRCVEEARRDGEIVVVGSAYELAHFLGATLNGACLIGHSSPDTDWKRLFRRHARRALGLLGAPGATDPPAPRVPKPYRSRGGPR